MKILVSNYDLNKISGTSTYTYYLIEALIKRGFQVEYFTNTKGFVSDKIEKLLKIPFLKSKKFDLVLANHNNTVDKLWKLGLIIQTIHGVIPYLEKPSVFADGYVAISQEIQNILAQKKIYSYLIPNGINLETFKSINPINLKLKTVLSLCQSDIADEKIKLACQKLDVKFITYKTLGGKQWNISKLINQADLVVGLGRSAYDSIACGRPVLIYDEREYMKNLADGYLTPILTTSFSKNCSGRFYKKEFDVKDIIEELKKYHVNDGLTLHNFAKDVLDINHCVDKYLLYYNELTAKKSKIQRLKNLCDLLGKKTKSIFQLTNKNIIDFTISLDK